MPEKEKIQVEFEVPSKALNVKNATCPNGHSLISEEIKFKGYNSIRIKIRSGKNEGFLFLDPVYGSYNQIEEGIKIQKGDLVAPFCPECGVSLIDEHETCHLCASPLFTLHLPGGSIAEGCTKKGCLFHKIKIVGGEEQASRIFDNMKLDSYL